MDLGARVGRAATASTGVTVSSMGLAFGVAGSTAAIINAHRLVTID